ncbi:hypothetical protein JRQ81_010676 [Phrynocephalus forsythii]|uniref:Uncharacterized protein n=1 Tax=Phrynocephalus forsythii TaxID=171643 RepID=A0A9Q0X733_9SAUR|nr:hypothetical protein JRQ81_010676 [Phrynocephalus forsythii]
MGTGEPQGTGNDTWQAAEKAGGSKQRQPPGGPTPAAMGSRPQEGRTSGAAAASKVTTAEQPAPRGSKAHFSYPVKLKPPAPVSSPSLAVRLDAPSTTWRHWRVPPNLCTREPVSPTPSDWEANPFVLPLRRVAEQAAVQPVRFVSGGASAARALGFRRPTGSFSEGERALRGGWRLRGR